MFKILHESLKPYIYVRKSSLSESQKQLKRVVFESQNSLKETLVSYFLITFQLFVSGEILRESLKPCKNQRKSSFVATQKSSF